MTVQLVWLVNPTQFHGSLIVTHTVHILIARVFTRLNSRSTRHFTSEVLLLASSLLAWSLCGHSFDPLKVDLLQVLGLAVVGVPGISGDLGESFKRSDLKTALINELLDVLLIKFFKFIFKLDELAIVRIGGDTLAHWVVAVT